MRRILCFYGVLACIILWVGIAGVIHSLASSSQIGMNHIPMASAVMAAVTNGGQVSFDPASANVTIGGDFAVVIKTNSGVPVNAVALNITYPAATLSLTEVQNAGSSFNVVVPDTSSSGALTIIRGSTTPLTGSQTVATLLFKAKTAGTATISLASGSSLVSSENNTNILTDYGVSSILVLPPATATFTPTPTPKPTATPTPTRSTSSGPTATPTPTSFVPTPTTVVPTGGFIGEYYDNKDFTGVMKTRMDPVIDFSWGWGSPITGINRNTFSVRWTKVENFVGGTYQFTVRTDDGMRIYIDNKLIYNDWRDHSAKTKTFETYITPGQHTVKLEYYENRGRAVAKVDWERISQ